MNATRKNQQLLSIIIPVHNEQEVLQLTYERITAMSSTFADEGLGHEVVFVNDGSSDESGRILDDFARQDRRVRVIHFARNFGHQPAVTAGLTAVHGDVVAIMDADLQDPPEVLDTFLEKWRNGYQVVYAIRSKRKEGPLKRMAYWAFYRIYRAISELEMPLDSGDFCVLDRSAVKLLNSLPERQRFVRGLRTWIGLRQVGVTYERHARAAGKPSYTFLSLFKLAMDGLISFSTLPLRLVTSIGIVCMFIAAAIGIWVLTTTVYQTFFGGNIPRGWASLACIIVFFSSVQLLSLGIIGEYLNRIFLEVKGRPTYLISRVVENGSEQPTVETQDFVLGANEVYFPVERE